MNDEYNYRDWVEAIQRGNVDRLQSYFASGPAMLAYRTLPDHNLRPLYRNSAHLAASAGQAGVVSWLAGRVPDFLLWMRDQDSLPQDASERLRSEQRRRVVEELFTSCDYSGKSPVDYCMERLVPGAGPEEGVRFLRTLLAMPVEVIHPRLDEALKLLPDDLDDDLLDLALEASGELSTEKAPEDQFADLMQAGRFGIAFAFLQRFTQALCQNPQQTFETARLLVSHSCLRHLGWLEMQAATLNPVDWGLTDNHGRTLLHYAAETKTREIGRYIARRLPSPCPFFGLRDAAGRTPLQVAGKCENVDFLLGLRRMALPIPALDARFALWSIALSRSIKVAAKAAPPDRPFFLPYGPRELCRAGQWLFADLTTEGAVEDLLGAVRRQYSVHGWPTPRTHAKRVQFYVPMIVASVIAAERMDADRNGQFSAANYYVRLSEVICGGSRNPPQQTHNDLRTAWNDVRRGLDTPNVDYDDQCPVQSIVRHARLRDVDLRRLPGFFEARGFRPHQEVVPSSLAGRLRSWATRHLTLHALHLLDSDRRTVVLEQVAEELGRWDGEVVEIAPPASGRSARYGTICWQIRDDDDEFAIGISASRLDGFPDRFPIPLGGQRAFDTHGGEKYLPISFAAGDWPWLETKLGTGFEFRCQTSGDNQVAALRWNGQQVIPFVPSTEAPVWVSSDALLLNSPCLILCHRDRLAAVTEYVHRACGHRDPVTFPLLNGWTLFHNVTVVAREAEPPNGLDYLRPVTETQISVRGGLKLGGRNEWLADCPPKVSVSGDYHATGVVVNGNAAQVDAQGVVDLTPHGHEAVLTIAAGSASRTITLCRTARHPSLLQSHRIVASPHRFALDERPFYLLGSRMGEVSKVQEAKRARVVDIPFEPAWVLSYGNGRRVYATGVAEASSVPSETPIYGTTEDWRDAVRCCRDTRTQGWPYSPTQWSKAQIQGHWSALVQDSLKPIDTPQPPALRGSSQPSSKDRNRRKRR